MTLAHLGGAVVAPTQVLVPILLGVLYVRRVRTLAPTPRAVPGWRQACFLAGVGLIVAIANYTLTAGQLVFEGIVLGTVATLVIYHLMDALERLRGPRTDARDDHAPPATAPAGESR